MIELSIDLDDITNAGQKEFGSEQWCQSRIQKFNNNILSSEFDLAENVFWFWAGEQVFPYGKTRKTPELCEKLRNYRDCEGVFVLAEKRPESSSITICRTYAGTCPIYISVNGTKLCASWRYEDVVENLGQAIPSSDACSIFIEHGATRIREQVISGTYMLWPGESVCLSDDGLQFRDASLHPIATSTPVADDANVCEAFFEIICADLRRFSISAQNPLLELSGGLDSSTLAMAAGMELEGLKSYGLIQLGVLGAQQRRRRAELIAKCRATDFEYDADRHPPFAGLELEECAATVFDDNHRTPCVAATDSHPNGPFDLLIAGIGGDELMMEDTYTYREWEVPGTVCTSSVVAGVARSDMFLRRGIWPINPLCAPALIDFCRALPTEYRKNRLLVRLNLARLGLSDGFIYPRYREHYGHTMRNEMALIDFDELFSESIVMDMGICKLNTFLKDAREAHFSGFSYELMGQLWNIAKLERVLSRYTT